MDPHNLQHIIAATATKRLELAGGSIMEQALPEDYVLANFILRALEERNGQELEFALKSYLRIHIVPIQKENTCFLVEPLGLTATEFKSITDSNLIQIIEDMKNSKTLEEFLDLIRQGQKAIDSILEVNESNFVGVMSEKQASEFMFLLECPTKSEIEPYSITFPEVIEPHELEQNITQLKTSIQVKADIDLQIRELLRILTETMTSLISEEESIIERHITQLDRRIESLEQRITELEGREGTDEILTVRRQALLRDQARRIKILTRFEEKSRQVLEESEDIKMRIEKLKKILTEQSDSLKNILAPIGSTEISPPWTILMAPFIVIGFSKKGQLKVSVYPPSKLKEVESRVGIRRDFIDVLDEASDYLLTIALQLSERANSDVNMRKYLRKSSEIYNLLSLKESRTLLRDGVKSLSADGFVKQSYITELDSILNGFAEQDLVTKEPIKIKPVSAHVKDGQCHVTFHVYDDQSHPVENAELDLGGMVIRTDIRGSAEINLTKSNYEAVISAVGFRNKSIEFRLHSSDDVVIPVLLTPLPPEERLAKELDRLIERAKHLDLIRDRLWQAFQKQGDTLLSIPAYRGVLIELLSELGYEPESWISEAQSERGMVKRLLKRDDREDALRRDILRLAEESKESGGLMLFSELLLHLDKMGWATSYDEIETTLEEMTREGLLEGISLLENGTRLVKFIPVALTDDPQKILNLAAGNAGKLTIEEAVLSLDWTEERVMNALNLLVGKGVAKVQKTYSKSTIYWFPGLQEKE